LNLAKIDFNKRIKDLTDKEVDVLKILLRRIIK